MQSLEAALRRKDPNAHLYFAPKSIPVAKGAIYKSRK
jgi:hypothetical protein